jgi:hypothetical protein
MNEDSLAQQGMPQPIGSPVGGIDPRLLEQVMALLQQGVTPEELMAQGVPPEVISAAIDMLMQQGGGAQQPEPMAPATAGGAEAAGSMRPMV